MSHGLCKCRWVSGHVRTCRPSHICLEASCKMRAGGGAVRRKCHIKERPHFYAHDISKDDSVKRRASALIVDDARCHSATGQTSGGSCLCMSE